VARRTQRPMLNRPAAPITGGSEAAAQARAAAPPRPRRASHVILHGLAHAVKQPYVWAPVIGLVLVLIGVPIPVLVASMLNLIGQTTSGVSLFVAGLMLAAYSIKLNGVVGISALLKSVAQPALMLLLASLAGIHNPLAREGAVAGALPSAVIAPMIAARASTARIASACSSSDSSKLEGRRRWAMPRASPARCCRSCRTNTRARSVIYRKCAPDSSTRNRLSTYGISPVGRLTTFERDPRSRRRT